MEKYFLNFHSVKHQNLKRLIKIGKEILLDILFPKFCVGCGKEGTYLCEDCFYLIEILEKQYCPFCQIPKIVLDGRTCPLCRKSKKLTGLFCATSYENFLVKKIIHEYKYSLIKELAIPLSLLIIIHFYNLGKLKNFSDFILIPVPLHKKKLKNRGFNQAEEIAKELSKFLNIPLLSNGLIKTKQTKSQTELQKEDREKNVKGVFVCTKNSSVRKRKILLVDDIFTTGATMEECARVLKEAGAREVWGVVVARG